MLKIQQNVCIFNISTCFQNKIRVFEHCSKCSTVFALFVLGEQKKFIEVMSDSPLNLVLLINYKLGTNNCILPIKLNHSSLLHIGRVRISKIVHSPTCFTNNRDMYLSLLARNSWRSPVTYYMRCN